MSQLPCRRTRRARWAQAGSHSHAGAAQQGPGGRRPIICATDSCVGSRYTSFSSAGLCGPPRRCASDPWHRSGGALSVRTTRRRIHRNRQMRPNRCGQRKDLVSEDLLAVLSIVPRFESDVESAPAAFVPHGPGLRREALHQGVKHPNAFVRVGRDLKLETCPIPVPNRPVEQAGHVCRELLDDRREIFGRFNLEVGIQVLRRHAA